MDAQISTQNDVVDGTPPFELEHLVWSNEATVARTDQLDVAREAEKRLLAAGKSIVEAQELDGGGVYRLVYADVYRGGFAWGTQVYRENEISLYYFGSYTQRLRFLVLDEESYTHFTGPYDEAEVIHRELGRTEHRLWPTLS